MIESSLSYDLIKISDLFPINMNVSDRIALVYWKIAFLAANKYLKESGLITRYKGSKQITEFSGPEWNRLISNIVIGLINKELVDASHIDVIKKAGDQYIAIHFKRLTGYGSTPERVRVINLLNRIDRKALHVTFNLLELEYYGGGNLNLNLSNLDLFFNGNTNINHYVTLETFHGMLVDFCSQLKEILGGWKDE